MSGSRDIVRGGRDRVEDEGSGDVLRLCWRLRKMEEVMKCDRWGKGKRTGEEQGWLC